MSSWTTVIEKLMQWRIYTGWSRYETSDIYTLKMHNDQIFILSNQSKVLESININGKMKGFLKGNVLVLVFLNGTEGIRKIKLQLPKDSIQECVEKLIAFFPIINHSSDQKEEISGCRYRKLDYVLKDAINKKVELVIPPSFENFVKVCLMDPTFPAFVNETEKVLQSINISIEK